MPHHGHPQIDFLLLPDGKKMTEMHLILTLFHLFEHIFISIWLFMAILQSVSNRVTKLAMVDGQFLILTLDIFAVSYT